MTCHLRENDFFLNVMNGTVMNAPMEGDRMAALLRFSALRHPGRHPGVRTPSVTIPYGPATISGLGREISNASQRH